MPRDFRSRNTEDQLAMLSRYPLSTDRTTFRPSRSAPMTTKRAAFSFSKPAFTYTPSTQT